MIAAISAVVFLGCKKERSFRGANPGDEIVFGGTAGSASGFSSSKTKGCDGDSSVAETFAGTDLDSCGMDTCSSYVGDDSDADETYFFDWEDFKGGEALGGSSADNEIHDASSVVNTCKGLSGSTDSESLSGEGSGVSCGSGLSEVYSGDRAKGVSSLGGSNANALFGASDSDVQTKTDYSGNKNIVGGKMYERIDWKVGDKVRIFGDNVMKSGGAPSNMVYKVTSPRVKPGDQRRSSASLEKESAGTMGLRWGSGKADFYAVYPGNSPSKVSFNNGANFGVAVKMPKEQNTFTKKPSGNHIDFKPDMELAPMLAVSRGVSPRPSVQLNFLPLVTTFRITLSNSLGEDITIKKVSLVSKISSEPLAGNYMVRYKKPGGSTLSSHSALDAYLINYSNFSQEVSVNLGANAVTLRRKNGNTLSVTLFAMSLMHRSLQLKINVTQGGKTEERILDLKKNVNWLPFNPYKKYEIKVGIRSKMKYHLEVSPNLSINYIGGNINSGWVKSYKYDGVETKPVPWNVVGYSVKGPTGPFTSTRPVWLTNLTSGGVGVNKPSSSEKLYVTIAAQRGNLTRPNAKTTALRNKSEVGSKVSPIDLSRVPVGNSSLFSIPNGYNGSHYASKPMNTANCYVVTRPGWYKIPVVYGNAIKNNRNNQNSYISKVSGPNVLKNFIRGDGQPITKPWIKDNFSLSTGVAGLVWQDWPNLVQDISLQSDKTYIVFHVSKNQIHEGNAVISLKYHNDIMVWSWHIWVTASNMKTINVKNNKAKAPSRPGRDNFDFLSENLGACYDGGEAMIYPESKVWIKVSNGVMTKVINITRQKGQSNTPAIGYNNTYYQWGRKDPMLPSNGLAGSDDGEMNIRRNKTWFDNNGNMSIKCESMGLTSCEDKNYANYSIELTIRNPFEFAIIIGETFPKMIYHNLWDTSFNEKISDHKIATSRFLPVTKSVYDPCPPGFCLPPNGAFTGFRKSNEMWGTLSDANIVRPFNKGWKFRTVLLGQPGGSTIFFPASGFRCLSHYGITADDIMEKGHYSSATFLLDNHILSLEFGDVFVFHGLFYPGIDAGCSIRPVREI
ncbi:MAG: hypothetical protein ACTTK1_03835 [Candidatus Cryptobacteroides sp.]